MIEKLEFYHGAALLRMIEDARFKTISKRGCGYCVNRDRFVAIKYSTKSHSPWGFSFSGDDIVRLRIAEEEFDDCVIALVCGGDGVCALFWSRVAELLKNSPGGISTRRGFAGCYAVRGPAGRLQGRVAMNRWPSILFDETDKIEMTEYATKY
jgi:hypothetical protein